MTTHQAHLPFDMDDILGRRAELAARFQTAEPFPHLVIDGFLRPEVARAALEASPGSEDPSWVRYHDHGAVPFEFARHRRTFAVAR